LAPEIIQSVKFTVFVHIKLKKYVEKSEKEVFFVLERSGRPQSYLCMNSAVK